MSKKLTTEEYVARCLNKYGATYDYSITKYVSSHQKIKYICPRHGVIEQIPYSHLHGKGCPLCSNSNSHEKEKDTKESFTKKARKIHGDKYDYSKVDYIDSQTKVSIICHKKDLLGNEHGVFFQKPNSHLNGHGCPRCNGRMKSTEEWIEEAKRIYGEEKYSFDKTIYTHARDKLIVTCNKHGDFVTLARDFLGGHGCPKCNMPKNEMLIINELEKNSIEYISQYKQDWLSGMSYDIFVYEKNIAIECQGEQHFLSSNFFDRHETLDDRKKRDEVKKEVSNKHNIELVYFFDKKLEPYYNGSNKYFTVLNDLISFIINYGTTG